MTNFSHVACSGSRALRIWVLLLLLFGGLPGVTQVGLAAEESDDASSQRKATDQPVLYETATVRARPLSRATASVTVLDRETIESLNVASVAELIRFAVGVDVASTGPRGGFATAQIRGGDPNYTTVLLDGVPLNDITDQVGGAFNLNSLSTAHIERIEVVRGPLSSFFGPTGLAGAINIVTRKGETATPAVSFGVAAGDDSALASTAVSQGAEEWDYFVGLTWEQAEDEIDGGEDEFEQLGLQANARFQLGSRAELRLSGRFATWDAQDYPDASGGIRLGTGETRESENDELSLGADLLFGSSERRHKIWLTGYRHKLDRVSPAIPSPDPTDPVPVVPASVEDTTYVMWQLGWTAPQIEFWNSRLNLGVDGRVEDGESDSELVGVSAIPYSVDRSSGGGFAEWLIGRGRTMIEVGARVDVVEGSGTEFSPRVGLFYLFSGGKTRLRASAGRAFKLPSFFALFVPIFGNDTLQPETVIGVDSGVDFTFKSIGLTTGLTLFYNQFEDLVTFDSTTFTHINVQDDVESQGAELTVDWTASKNILVHANVTYEDFDDPGSTSPLTHRPELFGAAMFVWRIKERTRWVLDGQWVSEVFDFQVPLFATDPDGTATTPGYQLFGTAVTVTVAPRWEVHARIDNLADKEYEPFIGFPGPDRSFRVGVRFRSH